MICIVAGEPTNLIAESNSTHVTVSWKSPVTGYVIYYQSEGGGNSSDIYCMEKRQRVTHWIVLRVESSTTSP